jgi:hypothetical protein
MLQTKSKIPIKVILTPLFFLIIPSIAILTIFLTYPELSKENFLRRIIFIIPTSIILIFISKHSLKYEKGTSKRFYLNVSYVIFTIIWLFGFLGGNIVISETWNNFPFYINLGKYVSLIIFVATINIIYFFLEYKVFKIELESKKLKTQFSK